MTALRFQTGGGGGVEDTRHPRPPVVGEKTNKQTKEIVTGFDGRFSESTQSETDRQTELGGVRWVGVERQRETDFIHQPGTNPISGLVELSGCCLLHCQHVCVCLATCSHACLSAFVAIGL